MSNNLKRILVSVFIYLLGFVGVLYFVDDFRNPPAPPDPIIITKIDTVTKEYISYEPKVFYIDTGSVDTILKYKDIDTTAILRDYFAKRYYSDSLIEDSVYSIVINDTVTENRLLNRSVNVSLFKRDTTIIIPYHQKRELFIGISTIAMPDPVIAPTISLRTKTDAIFGLGYDVIHNGIHFSYKKKIALPKKKYRFLQLTD